MFKKMLLSAGLIACSVNAFSYDFSPNIDNGPPGTPISEVRNEVRKNELQNRKSVKPKEVVEEKDDVRSVPPENSDSGSHSMKVTNFKKPLKSEREKSKTQDVKTTDIPKEAQTNIVLMNPSSDKKAQDNQTKNPHRQQNPTVSDDSLAKSAANAISALANDSFKPNSGKDLSENAKK